MIADQPLVKSAIGKGETDSPLPGRFATQKALALELDHGAMMSDDLRHVAGLPAR